MSMRPRIFCQSRKGFSLVELLIAIGVIAILIGLTLPAVNAARRSANRLRSQNNLKQIALATHNYATVRNFLPPTVGWDNRNQKAVKDGIDGSFFLHILPYIENGKQIYDQLYWNEPYYMMWIDDGWGPTTEAGWAKYRYFRDVQAYPRTPAGNKLWRDDYRPVQAGFPGYRAVDGDGNSYWISQDVKTYRAPADPTFGNVSDMLYYGNGGTSSYLVNREVMKQGPTDFGDIKDGFTQTILLAEGYSSCVGDNGSYALSRDNDWATHSVQSIDWYSWPRSYDSKLPNPDGLLYVEGGYADYGLDSYYGFNYGEYFKIYGSLTFGIETSAIVGMGPQTGTDAYGNPVYSNPVPTKNPTFQDQPEPNLYSDQPRWCAYNLPQSFIRGSINVALADGSVRSISPDVTYASWKAALTPAGRDMVGPDFFGN